MRVFFLVLAFILLAVAFARLQEPEQSPNLTETEFSHETISEPKHVQKNFDADFVVGEGTVLVPASSVARSKKNLPTLADLARVPPQQTHDVTDMHESNAEKFINAPGNGRHRGGAHVLMGDDAVRFITDSIEGVDKSDIVRTKTSKSPYGLWGSLKTRSKESDHPDFKKLANTPFE